MSALYDRYQAAHQAHRQHAATCGRCTAHTRCPEGQRAWAAFESLQDAYLERQRRRTGS
ncbi:hypothetical protein AB0M23_21460 [Streptomyces sp. NPDC052077]|uniref:hypothetical protein n=1 Tax=Streptomyces sp. NPDC052077 TaxID=3154757 RepID=UPI00341DC186